MRRVRLAASWLLFVLLLVPLRLCAADPPSDQNGASFAPQSSADQNRLPGRQAGGGSSTLEIAPQPSSSLPGSPDTTLEGAGRTWQQSNDSAARNRSYHRIQPDDGRRPYLGVQLETTTECLFGMEVHGFEVVSIDADSPAARGGLQARKPGTAMGDLETFGSVMAFPLALVVIPRLRRSGALGMPGDVIVAVDDHRVRTEQELMDALDPLEPGDTVYFTVIRPVVGGGHTTAKVALHIDRTVDPPRSSNNP